MKKRVLLIATGGTIASQDKGLGLEPTISGEDLLEFVPEIKEICDLSAMQVLNYDSLNLHPNYWIKIAETIENNYYKYDGFIISHGTDTLGYTAAAMSYMVQNPSKPIIITGSQKPIDENITDGKKNLLDAVRLSVSDLNGVFAVFDSKVMVGTRARKIMSKSYSAFESVNFPYVCDMGRTPFTNFTSKEKFSDVQFYKKIASAVCLIKLYPGMSTKMLRDVMAMYPVILIESFGAGGVPQNEYVDFLAEIKEDGNKPLIFIGTQVAKEGTDMKVTEIGRKALDLGMFETYDMLIETALVKLMWLLGEYKNKDDIVKNFYRPIHKDLLVKTAE